MALPTFQAAGAKAEGSTSCSPAWPAHQADDIGLLFLETRFLADADVPEGWTEVTDSPRGVEGGGTVSTTLRIYWRRAAGAAESTPTVNSSNHIVAQILTFRGCIATGNPWDVTAGDTLTSASTAVAIPGDTTTVNDCLIVVACAIGPDTDTEQFSDWANADLANVTERADSFTAIGNGGGFGVATGELATAGAYGSTTATAASSFVQGRISIALKPPAGGTNATVTLLAAGILRVTSEAPTFNLTTSATLPAAGVLSLTSAAPSFTSSSTQTLPAAGILLLTASPPTLTGAESGETPVFISSGFPFLFIFGGENCYQALGSRTSQQPQQEP